MKKLITTNILMLFFYVAFSQTDNIILKSGEEISSKIVEIGSTDIKYKKSDFLNGPNFVLPNSEIFMIKFSNGEKMLFENNSINEKELNEKYSILNEGTTIQLFAARTFSSKNLKVGSVVELRVKEAVIDQNGYVLIKGNERVYATINESQQAKGLGKQGSLGFLLQDIKTVDGQKVPAYLYINDEGKNRSGAAVGVGLLLFWPALFIKGKEAEIKAGTIMTAYTSETREVKVSDALRTTKREQSVNLMYETIKEKDCGDKPQNPNRFNNPTYNKNNPEYKAFIKKLKEWEECNN